LSRLPTVIALLSSLLVGAHAASAHEGWGIVARPDGTIYFTDIPTNTIWRLRPEGRLEIAARDKHSHALVATEDGSIYGTHEHSSQRSGEVWRLSPTGDLSVVFSAPRSFEMSFHPFLMTPDGTIYSTNLYAGPTGPHHLLRRSPSGLIDVAVANADGIDGLAFGPNGSVYFTDTTSLRRLWPDGTVTTITQRLTEPLWGEDLMGLTVESATSIFVADYSGNRVLNVDGEGHSKPIFHSHWPWSPTGVARQGKSTVVLEHLRMPLVILGNLGLGPYIRVVRIDADGTRETRVVVWGRYSWMAGAITFIIVMAMAAIVRSRRRRRKAPALE
jgi:sugar lactone lactonase YvrE